MPDIPPLTLDIALALIAALGGGLLAHALRQPLFVGYILGGVLVGPLMPGPTISDVDAIEQLAEIGVMLLMFTIGLEFSLRELRRVGSAAIGGGLIGVAAMIGLVLLLGGALGLAPTEALVLGAAISVSSTMVIGKLLMQRDELDSAHGRLMIGTLLVEDLAVVLMLMVLPALGGGVTLSEALVDVGWALLRGGAILIPVIALAIYVVPWIVEKIAYTRDVELFLLVALAFGLGTGLLTAQLGLSPAMGAFLAGLIISESEYVHETLARILPLRDLFVALFFVSVGLLIDPRAIVEHWPLVLGIAGLVVVGKGLLRGGLAALFAQPVRVSFFMALGFTQIGEFTFVMAQVGADSGVLSEANYNVVLTSALLTIIVSSSLFRATPALWRRLSAAFPDVDWPRSPQAIESTHQTGTSGHVVLCGYGRMGRMVADALIRFGIPLVVVERDPERADQLKSHEIPVVIGDATYETVLREAAPERALLVVIALPDFYNARQAFRTLQGLNATVPIVARAHWGPEREQLFREGITDVIQPEFEGAIEMVRHTLMHADVASLEVEGYIRETRQQRYGRLVQSWLQREDPGHRAHKLQEVPLSEGSPLAGHSLASCQVREHFGVSVLAIRRRSGELVSNPSPDTVFQAGDRVLVMGTPSQMIEFAEMSRGSD